MSREDPLGPTFELEAALAAEHARLVALCAYLSGDPEAADDLAQETLIEAWRNAHKLYAPHGYRRWLSAIARNVCLRWRRRRGRQRAWQDPGVTVDDSDAAAPDFEAELTRGELATLLDHALALLPAETRALLIERYIADSPVAEAARRLGLSPGAASVRLHRGKLALRRLLTTELRADAAAFGLLNAGPPDWQDTHLWCPDCGCRRLVGWLTHDPPLLALRCPSCHGQRPLWETNLAPIVGGLKGFRDAAAMFARSAIDFYFDFQADGQVPCPVCGQLLAPALTVPAGRPRLGLSAWCPECRVRNSASLRDISLAFVAARRFWGDHPRARLLPEAEIEAEGAPAVVVSVRSLTSADRLDLVFARDTYRLLSISGPSANV